MGLSPASVVPPLQPSCGGPDELLTSLNEVDLALGHPNVPPSSEETLVPANIHQIYRRLGETETSYYLPSRANGVNDMYLHLGFRASPKFVQHSRVRLVWAVLRMRHPLAASRVEMHNYDDIRFVYTQPRSPLDAISDADAALEFRSQSASDLVDDYLNGPRTLSNDRLSYLVVSHVDGPTDQSQTDKQNFDLLICATHYIGDGMAFHQLGHDFFSLLGSTLDDQQLLLMLETECSRYCSEPSGSHEDIALPASVEDRLPPQAKGKFHRTASAVAYQIYQRQLIGGQSFPRRSGLPRRTLVPTVSFDPERTKRILAKCKTRGVSVSCALFAVCNIAWAKTRDTNWDLPMMMYSALNLRPFLRANKSLHDSYSFLAIGYFNVVLPSFLPKDPLEAAFWHRARSAKTQVSKAMKNPLLIPFSHETANERGARARLWGMQDDGLECTPPPSKPSLFEHGGSPKAPSNALIGLSLLGNLDGVYKHKDFPDIELHNITTGSRQRSGGMLLFGFTFVSKLWLSFGYDTNGFDEEVVQAFWSNLLAIVDEYLVNDSAVR